MPVMTSSATSVASLDPEDTHEFADFGDRPVGVNLSCVSGKETRLHLRNELLNKYEMTYYIRSDSGKTVCRVNGEYSRNGFKSSKIFLDSYGRAVFTLVRKAWSYNQAQQAFSCEGNLLFSVRSKFSFTKTVMIVTLINAYDDKTLELEVRGKWTEGTAEVRLRSDGSLLARIGNRASGNYTVTVAAGVDLSFISAVAVAFNESSQQNKAALTD